MTPIFAHLHRWAAIRHQWGHADCMMFAADWVSLALGVDVAADLRGSYGPPDVCPVGRALRADPMPACARVCTGLHRALAPVAGDVALIRLPGEPWLMGALRVDHRNWALKTEGPSLLITRAGVPEAIWRVPHAA